MSGTEESEFVVLGLAECLAEAFETVFGARPSVDWTEETRASSPSEGLWYRQTFSFSPNAGLLLDLSGIPWDIAVRQTAGPEGDLEVTPQERLHCDLMTALAGALTRRNAFAVNCGQAERIREPPEAAHAVRLRLSFNAISPLDLFVALEPEFAARIRPLLSPAARYPAAPPPRSSERQNSKPPDERLSILADVELEVSASFGGAKLALRDVLQLNIGSIVELDRTVNDPVQVIVNNRVIANGEAVVVEGNYGVRILDIVGAKVRRQSAGA